MLRGLISSVVGYHRNPLTCGVAKFNDQLARRIGVPFVGLTDPWGPAPLLSLKWSELDLRAQLRVLDRCKGRYSVFWHDAGSSEVDFDAQHVISAVTDLWCPAMVEPPVETPIDWTLFTFGMANKIQAEPYVRIAELLQGRPWRLRVSVALHEGTDLHTASMHFDALEATLGDRVQVLGCLSDQALIEQMRAADVVCAFFPQGVRANNTSVHAAMSLGCPVLTHLDALSPPTFRHGVSVMDLHRLATWPDRDVWRSVAGYGQRQYDVTYAWPPFLAALEACLYEIPDDRPAPHRRRRALLRPGGDRQ